MCTKILNFQHGGPLANETPEHYMVRLHVHTYTMKFAKDVMFSLNYQEVKKYIIISYLLAVRMGGIHLAMPN